MSLRTSINWLITLVMLLFIDTLAALQISAARRSTAAEMEAATQVTVQLLVSLIGNENARQGAATPEAIARTLEQTGRIRAHDIEVLDAAHRVLHHSPPSPWKAGRYAPAWFAALVAPQSNVIVLPVGTGSLRIAPDDSRMVLDAWDELLNLFWLSLLLFTLLNLLVFWFAGRTVKENHTWMQLIQRHIEDERRNLAHELHDEIGQSITALQIHLNLLQVELHQQGKGVLASRLTGIAEKIGEGVRGVVMDLAPIELAELGLYMALAHGSSARIARQAGLQYDVRFRGRIDDLDRLDASTALAAYRIVQESLTNVVKHAHAASCRVTLALRQWHGEWLLFVAVQDDGVGLARGVKAERCFVSIRDRALALSGRLHVRSRYGLRIHVLLRQPAEVTGNRRDRRRSTNALSAPI